MVEVVEVVEAVEVEEAEEAEELEEELKEVVEVVEAVEVLEVVEEIEEVEVEGVEEEERREATRELIRKTEKLEIFLQQRPSAAELIEKNIIPRSVIDAGEATWQVKKALVTEAVFVFLFPKRHSLTSLSLFLSFFINSVSCAGA